MPCLLLMSKNDAWKSSLRSSIKNRIPEANQIEFDCTLTNSTPLFNPSTVPIDHNGDAWIFAHGTGAFKEKKDVVDKNYKIFGKYNVAKQEYNIVNSARFSAFLHAAGIRRLFVFACYQGNFLSSFILTVPSLERVEGILTAAPRAAAGTTLGAYLDNMEREKYLEVVQLGAIVRERNAVQIASYAAAIASVTAM